MSEDCRSLLANVLDSGHLMLTDVDGVYARSGEFEDVVAALERLASSIGKHELNERIFFPPAMSRTQLEKSGYLRGFPNLVGTLNHFCGNEQDHTHLLANMEHGEDWTKDCVAGDLVMTPAACYPLYGLIARRGALPEGGLTILLGSYCFRREPSKDPARMQMFRMLEYVRMGTAEAVQDFRANWIDRGKCFARALHLEAAIDVANDPFFGRAGRVMASCQREQSLKFELLVPVSGDTPSAAMSFNYHQSHFADTWGLRLSDGTIAHTACVGFGLERLALALFRKHGVNLRDWPKSVRQTLWS